jgi:SAM-dependent methyltransferase
MKPEYYREYYRLERENWWFLARQEILFSQAKKLFARKEKIRILNVGAGLGATTIMLEQLGDVTSVEYDKYCCDFVATELGLEFIHGSITDLPFKEDVFDLVCAFDVVEHVHEDKLAISELYRVCKTGGYVFTTVPAFKFLWSQHDEINEHIRRYTLRNYTELFTSLNGKITFKSYFNFWLFAPIAIVRIVSSVFRKKGAHIQPKSDFTKIKSGVISRCLLTIFKSERFFLNRYIKLPVGVSVMVVYKKDADSKINS